MSNYKSYQELIEEKNRREKTTPKEVNVNGAPQKEVPEKNGPLPGKLCLRPGLIFLEDWNELGDMLLSGEDKYDFFLDRAKGFQATMSKNAQQVSVTLSQVQMIFPAVTDITQVRNACILV